MVVETDRVFSGWNRYALETSVTALDSCFPTVDCGDPARKELLGEPELASGVGTYKEDAPLRLP
jgi:hypothetical protein